MPVLLGLTLAYIGCMLQVYWWRTTQYWWVLCWYRNYNPTSDIGSYADVWLMYDPVLLGPTLAVRLWLHQWCWLLRWCTTRLQSHQCCWVLRWCMANVGPSVAGSYTEGKIIILPVLLGLTLMYNRYTIQCCWVLRWGWNYYFASNAGSYTDVWPMYGPVLLGLMLEVKLLFHQWCWVLCWHMANVGPSVAGSYAGGKIIILPVWLGLTLMHNVIALVFSAPFWTIFTLLSLYPTSFHFHFTLQRTRTNCFIRRLVWYQY